jgi:Zn finger protein HypA/HybF involved in hydrogenase expression
VELNYYLPNNTILLEQFCCEKKIKNNKVEVTIKCIDCGNDKDNFVSEESVMFIFGIDNPSGKTIVENLYFPTCSKCGKKHPAIFKANGIVIEMGKTLFIWKTDTIYKLMNESSLSLEDLEFILEDRFAKNFLRDVYEKNWISDFVLWNYESKKIDSISWKLIVYLGKQKKELGWTNEFLKELLIKYFTKERMFIERISKEQVVLNSVYVIFDKIKNSIEFLSDSEFYSNESKIESGEWIMVVNEFLNPLMKN